MELIILGESHNPAKEIEIFYNKLTQPFGFNVEVTYKEVTGERYTNMTKEDIVYPDGHIRTCNNVTEFHWLFSPNSMACESDIHGTGWAPWTIQDFKKIVVTVATEKNEDF